MFKIVALFVLVALAFAAEEKRDLQKQGLGYSGLASPSASPSASPYHGGYSNVYDHGLGVGGYHAGLGGYGPSGYGGYEAQISPFANRFGARNAWGNGHPYNQYQQQYQQQYQHPYSPFQSRSLGYDDIDAYSPYSQFGGSQYYQGYQGVGASPIYPGHSAIHK